LYLLKNRNKNINFYEKLISFLKEFKLRDTGVQRKLIEAINNLKGDYTLKTFIQVNNSLNELNLDLFNPKNIGNQEVIVKIYEKPELIKFIKTKKINEINQMYEFTNEIDRIYPSDINELVSCTDFIQQLKEKSEKADETVFLDEYVKLINNNQKFKDIGIKFENISGKYGDFYELFTNQLDPNKLSKVHIKNVYAACKIFIEFKYPEYVCDTLYNINGKRVKKSFEEMLDLRQIALYVKKDQKESDYYKICEPFANIIGDVNEILELLNVIISKGYYKEIEYAIVIENGNVSVYKKNLDEYVNYNRESLKEVINELKEIKENQMNEIMNVYLSSPSLRLIHDSQFNYLFKYMLNKLNKVNNTSETSIYNVVINIIKYITNNHINNLSNANNNQWNISNHLPLRHMFNDIGSFLDDLLSNNNTDLQTVYRKASLIDESKRGGVYSYSCSLVDIEMNANFCSWKLTGKLPIAQTVLYCNDDTSEEEIISFIYRCIKCDQSSLFIIIKPEILSTNKKNLLIELLNESFSQDMVSCLLFIYSKKERNKDIITKIESLPNHKYLNFNDNYNRINNNTNDFNYYINYEIKRNSKVEVYSSERSGMGKSTMIKTAFRNKYPNYKYVYFPIGNNIHKHEIIERLLKLTNKKIALHVDLQETDKIELIREFLFSFLVLRYYAYKDNIFYYGREMRIKIEIPNSSIIDFKQLFPIIGSFKNIHITNEDMFTLNPLIVPNDIASDTQIVAIYLKYKNQLNDHDIYIKNISQNKYSNCIIVEHPLPQEECSRLIRDHLNIVNPNYYQVVSYIKIVGEQLRCFSNSIYLNTALLQEYGRDTDGIRKFYVDSITSITKYFITSSYDNILNGQNITSRQQRREIDFEEAKQKAIENLTNKEQFSIEKIKPSLILINDDKQSLSIIPTCEKSTTEYRLLNSIYKQDWLNRNNDILEYTKLKPRQFLIEARKVLDLHNPIDSQDNQIKIDGKQLETLESIVKTYVFTADNFIKMILIYLRLRTKVPVILSGETGCGKTSLLTIMSKLKGIPLYTLNIHAGIEDKDIIEFIEKNNLFDDPKRNKDKIKEDKQVWVFLDEINTCNSLGLISEIMLKGSCYGEKIVDNVVFIAACNPYRLETKNKEISGQYDEKKNLSRKLLYNVNPLPHSLLNFVFDFGSPDKNDIKKYISNMVSENLKTIIKDSHILNRIQSIAEKAIFDAHMVIKEYLGISSVSLREVRRQNVIFEWFAKKFLKNLFVSNKYELSSYEIYLYALNLSIYLCYFIRIFNKDKRKAFINKMKASFGSHFEFEEFPKKIEELIASSVNLDVGIAKNSALLENLFAIFVCLNTKIPLFIIGKPGCSKTLSAKSIFESMLGKNSSQEFFKQFPNLIVKSYQGSKTSNSKGLLKLFKQVKDFLDDKKLSKETISAIFFDEMGLA